MIRRAMLGLVLFVAATYAAVAEEPVRVMSYNIRYATAPDGYLLAVDFTPLGQ